MTEISNKSASNPEGKFLQKHFARRTIALNSGANVIVRPDDHMETVFLRELSQTDKIVQETPPNSGSFRYRIPTEDK